MVLSCCDRDLEVGWVGLSEIFLLNAFFFYWLLKRCMIFFFDMIEFQHVALAPIDFWCKQDLNSRPHIGG